MKKQFVFSFWPFVITLTAFLILCKLGFWQLSRAEQKQQMLSQFSASKPVTTLELQQALAVNDLSRLHGRQINLDAKLQTNKLVFIDNRMNQSQIGMKILAPALIPEINRFVLIDLGWVARNGSRDELPSIELPSTLTLKASIKSQNLSQFMLQDEVLSESYPQLLQSPFTLLQGDFEPAVLPLILYAESNSLAGYPQTYEPVNMPPEKHQAYALQWFLLAVASVVVFFFASLRTKSITSEQVEL